VPKFTGELAPAPFSRKTKPQNYRDSTPQIQIERDSSAAAGRLLSVSATNSGATTQGGIMLYWTIMFLVIALIAGVLGFTGVAVAAAGIAKLLFVVFLVLFVISLFTHLSRRGV
jgi:uncharacterized membrane protein YtjA (UPF0391 family)